MEKDARTQGGEERGAPNPKFGDFTTEQSIPGCSEGWLCYGMARLGPRKSAVDQPAARKNSGICTCSHGGAVRISTTLFYTSVCVEVRMEPHLKGCWSWGQQASMTRGMADSGLDHTDPQNSGIGSHRQQPGPRPAQKPWGSTPTHKPCRGHWGALTVSALGPCVLSCCQGHHSLGLEFPECLVTGALTHSRT